MMSKQEYYVKKAFDGKLFTKTSNVNIISTIKRYEIMADDQDLLHSQMSKSFV